MKADPFTEPERWARLRLTGLAEPGDERLGRALRTASAVEVLDRIVAGGPTLAAVDHYRARLSNDPHRDAERLTQVEGRFLIPGDGEWPTQVMALGDAAPCGLFVVGRELRTQVVRSVAVVGARAATNYGHNVASDMGTDLAAAGWCVVSGGAFGIDAAAHRGAMAVGGTVAVLACGVDVDYPKGHSDLLRRIREESGTVVSELPPGRTPTKPRFLQRNRIIAALTRGTVVVEAAYRSGALNTAAHARKLGRPVMVVPGPVTSAQSEGCHRLARADEPARLVTCAAEVIEEVGMIGELAPLPTVLRRVRDSLDPVSEQVLEALPAESPLVLSEISRWAGIAVDVTSGVLLRLCAAGLVRQEGDCFVRVPGAADVVVRDVTGPDVGGPDVTGPEGGWA